MDDKQIETAAKDAVAQAKSVWGDGWEHVGFEVRMGSVTRAIVNTVMMAAPDAPVCIMGPIMACAARMVAES